MRIEAEQVEDVVPVAHRDVLRIAQHVNDLAGIWQSAEEALPWPVRLETTRAFRRDCRLLKGIGTGRNDANVYLRPRTTKHQVKEARLTRVPQKQTHNVLRPRRPDLLVRDDPDIAGVVCEIVLEEIHATVRNDRVRGNAPHEVVMYVRWELWNVNRLP